MLFQIQLAGKIISIKCIYSTIYDLCRDYLVQEDVSDIYIEILQSDIEEEKKRCFHDYFIVQNVRPYLDSYYETQAVHRKILNELLKYDTFLIHGSAVVVDGKTYIFTARSGVGKTTHSLLWTKNIPGSYILNGDKPLIKVTSDGAVVYGNPWMGKERIGIDGVMPLKGICLLQRSTENSIKKQSAIAMLKNIMGQIYCPEEKKGMIKLLQLYKRLNCNFYIMDVNNMVDGAWQTSYNEMIK